MLGRGVDGVKEGRVEEPVLLRMALFWVPLGAADGVRW